MLSGSNVATLGVAIVYMLIIVESNRGLICAPKFRELQADIKALLLELDIFAPASEKAKDILPLGSDITDFLNRGDRGLASGLRALLQTAYRSHGGQWYDPARWANNPPMTKLVEKTRAVGAVRAQAVELVPAVRLAQHGQPALLRLDSIDPVLALACREGLEGNDEGARRSAVKNAYEAVSKYEVDKLSAEFNDQRIALWLALVGLDFVVVGQFAFGHELTLLLGALGGFLAPLVSELTGRKRGSLWGVMILSPVGGALTAAGGLLLVQLLSDPDINLLGTFFQQNSWTNSDTSVALALALLFGFSGRLFSDMAISAGGSFGSKSSSKEMV